MTTASDILSALPAHQQVPITKLVASLDDPHYGTVWSILFRLQDEGKVDLQTHNSPYVLKQDENKLFWAFEKQNGYLYYVMLK